MSGSLGTGLAKAIALRTDLPQIVVPTTYARTDGPGGGGRRLDARLAADVNDSISPGAMLGGHRKTPMLEPLGERAKPGPVPRTRS